MIIKLLLNNPIVIGLVTIFLMLTDYFLTLLQERERKQHYSKHYQSYPVNTIEGNPLLQESVSSLKIINPRHLIATLIAGVGVPIAIFYMHSDMQELFLGFFWGIFLIVIMQHLSNFIGYRISRNGVHGKLWLHQKTGLLIQSGRYLSVTFFLLILSILSESQIIYGVTIAGIISSLRLYIWSKRIIPIKEDDLPPEENNTLSELT